MKKRLLAFLMLSILLFSACSREQSVCPEQVLLSLTEAEIGLPAGQIYLSGADQTQASYLSPEMIATLYGQGEPPWQLSLIKDYGIFLSTAQHPCEFAVFLCYSHSDTDQVAAMCQARLNALCIHYKDTSYQAYTQNARVAIMGKYVLLLISSDAEHALDVARRAL